MKRVRSLQRLDVIAVVLLATWAATAAIWYPRHGAAHLLWLCQVNLLFLALGILCRSGILVTAQLVALLPFHFVWNVDFWTMMVQGRSFLGFTDYMFLPSLGAVERCLSFFAHVFVAPVGLTAALAMGVHRRGWRLQTLQSGSVLLLTGAVTRPGDNINWAFQVPAAWGFEQLAPSGLYLGLIVATLMALYLLANRVMERLGRAAEATGVSTRLAFLLTRPDPTVVSVASLAGVLISSGLLSLGLAGAAGSRFLPAGAGPRGEDFAKLLEQAGGVRLGTSIDSLRFGELENRLVRPLPWSPGELPRRPGSAQHLHLKVLLSNLDASRIPDVPQEVTVTGARQVPGSAVWAVVASDRFYLQPSPDLSGAGERYRLKCLIGGRGVSEYVDTATGELIHPSSENDILGNGTGAIYALAVVEVVGRSAVSRSRFYLMKRRGLRLPEDIWYWWNSGRLVPRLSPHADLASSRLVFQSRSAASADSADVYTSDLLGYKARNLTAGLSAYAGLVEPSGAPVDGLGWIDEETLRFLVVDRQGYRLMVARDEESGAGGLSGVACGRQRPGSRN